MEEKNIVAKTKKLTVKNLDMRKTRALFLANCEGVWLSSMSEVTRLALLKESKKISRFLLRML
jgi:hypothetical protein